MVSPTPTVWNPRAASADAVSAAWLSAPVPFMTDTVTDDGAGSGSPVMESVVGTDAEHLVDDALVLGLRRELDVAVVPPWYIRPPPAPRDR